MSPVAPRTVRVVLDDAGDGSGVLAVPAATADPAGIAALVRHGCGFLVVTLDAAAATRLDLPVMQGAAGAGEGNDAGHQRVSVDAAAGVGTGISAVDRARTARLLADPTTVAADLSRPGHVVPVVADPRHPRRRADRIHRALGGPAVYADVPGGRAGTGLAGPAELVALAAALGIEVVRTSPHDEDVEEFLARLRAGIHPTTTVVAG